MEEARLYEQAKRNAARYQQECAELAAYEKHYGKVRNTINMNLNLIKRYTHYNNWYHQDAQSIDLSLPKLPYIATLIMCMIRIKV